MDAPSLESRNKFQIRDGIEEAHVIQGATIQLPGKEPSTLPTGVTQISLRDVHHGGF